MAGNRVGQRLATEIVSRGHNLAESPGWNSVTDEMFWVDIDQSKAFWSSDIGQQYEKSFPDGITSLKWRKDFPYLVTGSQKISFMSPNGSLEHIWEAPKKSEDWRFNDSLLLESGTVLVGTKNLKDGDSAARVGHWRSGCFNWWNVRLGLANGIAFDQKRLRLYIADSWRHEILFWDCSAEGLPIEPSRPSRLVSDLRGEPDGLVLDKDGNVYVALWGSGEIGVFSPEGSSVRTYVFPIPHLTSLAWMGEPGAKALVTSAKLDKKSALKPDALHAGDVFLFRANSKSN